MGARKPAANSKTKVACTVRKKVTKVVKTKSKAKKPPVAKLKRSSPPRAGKYGVMKKRAASQRKKKGDSVSHRAKAKPRRSPVGKKANKNGRNIAKKSPMKFTIKGKKQPEQKVGQKSETAASLKRLTLKALQDKCKAQNINSVGTKARLIERLCEEANNTRNREKNPPGSIASSAEKQMLSRPSDEVPIVRQNSSSPAFQKRRSQTSSSSSSSSPVIRAHPYKFIRASPISGGAALRDPSEEVKKRRRNDSSDSEFCYDVKCMGGPRGKQSLEPETRQTTKNLGSKSKGMRKIGEEDHETKEKADEKEKTHEGKSREKYDGEADEQAKKQKNWSAVNLACQESRLQFRGILTERNFTNWLWVKVIHDKLAETKGKLPEVLEDDLMEELNELFVEFLPKKKEESKDKKEKKDKKSSKKKAKKDAAVKWTRKEKPQVANLIKNMIYGSDGDKGRVSGWINFVSEKEVPVTCPWEFQLAHCLYRCLNMEYEFEKKKNAPDQRLFYAELRSLSDAISQTEIKYRSCFSEEDSLSSAPVNMALAIQKRLHAGSAGIKFDLDWYYANVSRHLSGSPDSKKNTHTTATTSTTTTTSTTSIKTREQGGEQIPEHSTPLSETLVTDMMFVEPSYDGPVYNRGDYKRADKIDAVWVTKLLNYQRRRKNVHMKFAYNMVLDVLEILKECRTVQLITVPESGKFTVCDNIHGQYDDLLKIWFKNGNPSEANPYLFNGDFVDRGSFSIEVMFGLFAWKLCYPRHLFMSRGYHETTKLNRPDVFEGEPTIKYPENMYRLFCEAFCYMPLAHILNDQVFAVHGGFFSKVDGKLSEQQVAKDRVREPPQEGFITENFWNDPEPEHGRAPSERNIGVAYGRNFTDNCCWLKTSNVKMLGKMLVRSHTMKWEANEIGHDEECISVFSAPNFCDQMGNKGAFIRFEGKTMTPIKCESLPNPGSSFESNFSFIRFATEINGLQLIKRPDPESDGNFSLNLTTTEAAGPKLLKRAKCSPLNKNELQLMPHIRFAQDSELSPFTKEKPPNEIGKTKPDVRRTKLGDNYPLRGVWWSQSKFTQSAGPAVSSTQSAGPEGSDEDGSDPDDSDDSDEEDLYDPDDELITDSDSEDSDDDSGWVRLRG